MPRLRTRALLAATTALLAAPLVLGAGPARADAGDPVDPAYEAQNYSKINERAAQYTTPEGTAALLTLGAENLLAAVQAQLLDPERLFLTDACWSYGYTCAGDPRLASWGEGAGMVEPVLWTARNGGTISGHVWATKAGAKKRPLIEITNGSVQAPETLYWFAAQTLAKAGYVVVTWDPQMQGQSDTFGEGADMFEGVPSQSTGVTFFDGTQDALDFALSTPASPYCPRPSRSGTDHCAKQTKRVASGRNAAYNPFWKLVDPTRIGIAGHSYGAAGVSVMGQRDRRVDAVVAWDNLCDPAGPPKPPGSSTSQGAGCSTGTPGQVAPRVPSLGLSADYFLVPQPYTTQPYPLAKSGGSLAFSAAGVDTGEIVIRGGTHYEFSYIPTPTFGATLRGIDVTAWYTTAWMDRYVKGDVSAQRRLLTTRWLDDAQEAGVDPNGDGNLYSTYFASRLDLGHDGGRRVQCEDLRGGTASCPALAPDGQPADYSYVAIATAPDAS